MNQQGPEPSGMDLRTILRILSKWRWVIITLTGAAVVTAALVGLFVLPKVYEAQSTVDVSYAAPSTTSAGPNTSTGLQGVIQNEAALPQNTLETYQFEVTNPSVLDATSQALQKQGISLSADDLGKMVKVSAVTGTNLLNIDVDTTSPTEAATIANTLTTSFLQFIQSQDQQKLSQAVGFLQQQTTTVHSELASATAALAKAEEANGSTQASDELTADTTELSTLQNQLIQAQVTLQSDEAGETALRQQLAATPPTVSNSSSTSQTQANPAYESLDQKISQQTAQVAEDEASVQEMESQLQTLESEPQTSAVVAEEKSDQSQLAQAVATEQSDASTLASMEKQLTSTPSTVPASGGKSSTQPNALYQTLTEQLALQVVKVSEDQATVSELQGQIATLNKNLLTLSAAVQSAQGNVASLNAEVQEYTQTYQTLSQSLVQAQVAGSVSLGSTVVTQVATAVPPTVPIKPKKKLDVALALVLGLVISVGLAFILEQMDTTVKTPEDIERLVHLPTLAVIPHVSE